MHATEDPDTSILDPHLDPIGRALTPEAAQQLAALQADPGVRALLEALAGKCT